LNLKLSKIAEHKIDIILKLEKFEGKGGWTYALIPNIEVSKKNPFGWAKVEGFIDDYELKDTKLMPWRGNLFLPIKAEIRKKIKKEVGDEVHLRISFQNDKNLLPNDVLECLEFENLTGKWKKLSKETQNQRIEKITNCQSSAEQDKEINALIDFLTNFK
jgi:hypothetical protein